MADRYSTVSVLRSNVLLRDLPEESLHVWTEYLTVHKYKKNTIVMNQEDSTYSLFMVGDGRCRLYRSDEDGNEAIISIREAGDYFGILALLDGGARVYSVQTLEPSTLYQISRDDFLNMLNEHPEVGLTLMRTMAQRMRRMAEDVSCLALFDVYGRISHVLNKEGKQDGDYLRTGRLTQQDLANMTGSSREMVGRILKDLKEGGYITVENKEILVLKPLPKNW